MNNFWHSFHRIWQDSEMKSSTSAGVLDAAEKRLNSIILHSQSQVEKTTLSSSTVQLLPKTSAFDLEEELPNSDQNSRKSSPLDVRLRRLRANDRERRRIQSINGAMEALRRVIPDTRNDRKVTKLQLLKLAQNYIRYLSGILTTNSNMGSPTIHQETTYRTSSGPPRDLGAYSFSSPTCDLVQADICFAQ